MTYLQAVRVSVKYSSRGKRHTCMKYGRGGGIPVGEEPSKEGAESTTKDDHQANLDAIVAGHNIVHSDVERW